ncbi:MAG TPA: hypothetical protein VGH74_22355 [Planctomycetaceae bacterium]
MPVVHEYRSTIFLPLDFSAILFVPIERRMAIMNRTAGSTEFPIRDPARRISHRAPGGIIPYKIAKERPAGKFRTCPVFISTAALSAAFFKEAQLIIVLARVVSSNIALSINASTFLHCAFAQLFLKTRELFRRLRVVASLEGNSTCVTKPAFAARPAFDASKGPETAVIVDAAMR